MSIIYDFSTILAALAALTGLIWLIDRALFHGKRAPGAREPMLVEYAGSFFPIILIVLLVRSFLFEPFRIPSDSMMPTLLDGDFIFVNKFAYGLRLPVVNVKFVEVGSPKRGDVIVFRKPNDPGTNYIKRLVGLPGDKIEVRGAAITVNGQRVTATDAGLFAEDGCYQHFRQGLEQLGEHSHRIMYCPTDTRRESGCSSSRDYDRCIVDEDRAVDPVGDPAYRATQTWTVPAGDYFFMGDNRDNSGDSRFPDLGYVPQANVVGKAVRIWLNIGLPPRQAIKRIGQAIR